jgi:hypothetical protein
MCFITCFSFVPGALAQTTPASPTGNSSQDFGGIRTFLRAPHVKDFAALDADIVVVGMPSDQGSSCRPAQRYGPRDIREASLIYAWAPQNGFYYIDTGQTVLKGKRWAPAVQAFICPLSQWFTSTGTSIRTVAVTATSSITGHGFSKLANSRALSSSRSACEASPMTPLA